jgi:hypothetical protein
MPQQFLHDFEFRAHASQQRRIRVTKRVPVDTFLDSNSLCNRPNGGNAPYRTLMSHKPVSG